MMARLMKLHPCVEVFRILLPGVRHVRVERNQGVAGARNIGLLESNSDYIAFLDDDDLRKKLEPTANTIRIIVRKRISSGS